MELEFAVTPLNQPGDTGLSCLDEDLKQQHPNVASVVGPPESITRAELCTIMRNLC